MNRAVLSGLCLLVALTAGASNLDFVDPLIGFILTRQPAIWMGDWGEVRIPIELLKIGTSGTGVWYNV